MWVEAAAILSLGVVCAGWMLLRLWIRRVDPSLPDVEHRCGGCGAMEQGEPWCERRQARCERRAAGGIDRGAPPE